jgi:UDP-glucuronate 4-epimerase
MSKILVTGAAGFIGSHLCEALVGRGDEVIGLDNLDEFYDPAVKRRNLVALSGNEAFQFVQGDIRDRTLVEGLLARGIEVVMHLAARAGVRPSIEQPLLYQDVNINGTMVLLEACRELGVKRFIFSSSSSVYGNNEKVPFSESDNVDFPISPYAATKKAGELICHCYHHLYDLDVTCLRFFTVYGPRQRPDLAVHKFARLIEAGRPIPVFGDGTMMRDFTYIDDIIDGVVRAIDRCKGYRIYNLGESQPVALADLITMLEEALGKKAIIERMPLQPGDVNRTFADVSLAGRDLGYRPVTPFRLGLQKFVDWLREESEGS